MSAPEAIDQECVEGYLYVRDPPRLLILRRPPSRDSIWVPVSGKVERSDPGFREALLRELREETGFVEFRRIDDLQWAVPFDGPSGGRWRLHAFGVEMAGPEPPRLSPEHVDFAWLSIAEARERLHYADNREAVDRLTERLRVGEAPRHP